MGKLVLIEDDVDLTDMMVSFFKQKGHTITCFEDPELALKEIEEGKAHADVILTDLNMPKYSGFEVIKHLRERGILTPVIVTTAQKGIETAVEAIQLGAFDYVIKPLNFPQLQISVERALHYAKLNEENRTLKTALSVRENGNLAEIKCKSAQFSKVLELAKRVAPSMSNVLITGESGSGKEVIARLIHSLSKRSKKPFVAINCTAIPEHLLESELFGHAKGSFTGAVDKKMGLFEEANGGTLFLDEIGDMNLQLQAKLLRVIQERTVRRVGENSGRPIDVRILSATHKDLPTEIKEGRFREDLYFRLRVIPIAIPALRERKDDILPLAQFFLKKFSSLNGSNNIDGFTPEAAAWLMSNPWKGNVRELENAIERAVVLSQGGKISREDLVDMDAIGAQPSVAPKNDQIGVDLTEVMTVDELVKKYIRVVLKRNNGVRDKTAKDLAIDRKTLYRKLQEMEFNESQLQ